MSLTLYRFLFAAAVAVALAVGLVFAAPAHAQTADSTAAPATAPAAPSLLASLDADGRFTTLAAALRQTGLADTLAAAGEVTVFAPTDDAFAALGAGALDALSTADLAAILLRHVVAGTVPAADVAAASELDALGGTLAVSSTDDGVAVGGARVTEADVSIGAVTVHVVDAVLSTQPPMSDDAPDGSM